MKEHYHFDCNCQLCQDEEKDSLRSSLVCNKHEKDFLNHCVPIKTGKCIKCGARISEEMISKHQRLKNSIIKDPRDLSYSEWFNEAHGFLHPFDSAYFLFAQKCTRSVKSLMEAGRDYSFI